MAVYDVLPPGLSAARFTAALAEFRHVVGDEYVIVEPDRLVPYRKIMIPADEAGATTPEGA